MSGAWAVEDALTKVVRVMGPIRTPVTLTTFVWPSATHSGRLITPTTLVQRRMRRSPSYSSQKPVPPGAGHDSPPTRAISRFGGMRTHCLLYTSDAADDLL